MKCMFSMALGLCAILSGLPLSAAIMATSASCDYIWPAHLPPQTVNGTTGAACFTTSPDGSTASAQATSGWGTYGPTVTAWSGVTQTSPIWAPDAEARATYDADITFTMPPLGVAGPFTIVPLLYVESISDLAYLSNAYARASMGPVTIDAYLIDTETTLVPLDPFSIPVTPGSPLLWHLHLEADAGGMTGSSLALFQGFRIYVNGSHAADFDPRGALVYSNIVVTVPEPSTAPLVLSPIALLCLALYCRCRLLSKPAS